MKGSHLIIKWLNGAHVLYACFVTGDDSDGSPWFGCNFILPLRGCVCCHSECDRIPRISVRIFKVHVPFTYIFFHSGRSSCNTQYPFLSVNTCEFASACMQVIYIQHCVQSMLVFHPKTCTVLHFWSNRLSLTPLSSNSMRVSCRDKQTSLGLPR